MALIGISIIGIAGCQVMPGVEKPAGPQFVRIEKIDGRYWFVRGNDRFVSLGVNAVEPVDFTKTKDGLYYNVLPKYTNDAMAWAKVAVDRLHTWNFNTVGGWSHDAICSNFPIYHTRVVHFGPWGNNDSRLVDVFGSMYSNSVDYLAKKEVSPHVTNEYLIGYYANNELPWYGEKGWPSSPSISLISRYMNLPEVSAGKIRLIEFLKTVYSNDFEAFSANWSVKANSFEEMLKIRHILPKNRLSKKDTIAWSGIVADQFFHLCSNVIRKYDPNHLFLGSRFAERAQEPVMAACGKYADAISVNHYRKTGILDLKKIGTIAAIAQKPVMITEFSWRAMENSSGCPNTRGADVSVPTQKDRAIGYRTYVTNALAQPYIIGLDWFAYHDEPPSGRFDGENSNYGLVDIYDNVYTTLVATMTEINGQASTIHKTSTTPMPVYDPNILADYKETVVPGTDKPPARPIVFADTTSKYKVWGDYAREAKITMAPTGSSAFVIDASPGSGWGCGTTIMPVPTMKRHPDESVNVLGGSKMIATIRAPEDVKFTIGIDESGCGGLDSQVFDGYEGADGESYQHAEMLTKAGTHEYVFDLRNMEPNAMFGNQRGNNTVNTEAIGTLNVYFPAPQKPFKLELVSIRFE